MSALNWMKSGCMSWRHCMQETNMVPECIQMCDRIMLMFGIGKYVDMAMELKTQFAPNLVITKVDLVENRDKYEAKLKAVEEEYEGQYDNQFQPDDQFQDQGQDQPEYGQQEQQYVDQDPYADQGSYVGENQYVDQSQYTEAGQSQYVDTARHETQPQYAETQEEPYAAQPPYDEQQPEEIQPEYDDYQEPEVVVTEDTEIAEEDRTEKGDQETEELMEEPVRTQRDLHNIKPVTKNGGRSHGVLNAPGTEEDGVEEEPAMQPMMANHLMIEAKTPEKGLLIAIDALKKIHNELGCNNQVVKISAGKLNQRGLMTIADKLAGKDLIVEEAGDLQENELEALQKLISRDETGMIIVLIDNPYQMEQLHKQNPGLAAQFECIGSEKDDTQTSIERAVQKQIELETQIAREEELPDRQKDRRQRDRGKRSRIKIQRKSRSWLPEENIPENEEIMDQEPEAAGEIEEKMDQEEEDAPESEEEQPEETYAEPEDDTEMDLDAFANYACDYARSIDCSLEG